MSLLFPLRVFAAITGDSPAPSGVLTDGTIRCGWQKLTGRLTEQGLRLRSTAADGGAFGISAVRTGREDAVAAFPDTGTWSVEAGIGRWVRPGVIEEISAGVDGVRQDFLLTRRPEGTGRLRLLLRITGADTVLSGSGLELTLHESGRKLTYSRLRVTDASGRELPAAFSVSAEGLPEITMDDTGASWPLRVDPTVASSLWVSMNDTLAGVDVSQSGTLRHILAVAMSGDNIYVGGLFTKAGNVAASNVARWDGERWHALGSGITGLNGGPVNALLVNGGYLYAGGDFFNAGGVDVGSIARWDGSSWSSVGGGIGGVVFSLAASGGSIYAGGAFTSAGLAGVTGLAKWDSVSGWSAVGGGVAGTVRALTVSGSQLYAGGSFATAGGVPAANIAMWNGTAWSPVGGGISGGDVRALAVSAGVIWAGGQFISAGGAAASRIAAWDGTAWAPAGAGVNGAVYALTVSNGILYAGGAFTAAGGLPAPLMASWDGTAWQSHAFGGTAVYGLASAGGVVSAGGSFVTAQGGLLTTGGLAQFRDGAWHSVHGGSGPDNQVRAVAPVPGGFYAAGNFSVAGGVVANGIAKWDGVTWHALGTGVSGGYVSRLKVMGTDLYAAGTFTSAGGIPVQGLAKWNGSSWQDVGGGVNGAVTDMEVYASRLYVAGSFSLAGGLTVNGLALWNGVAWENTGGPGSKTGILALEVLGSDLYAAGTFTSINGVTASRIAKWNGSAWSVPGSGITGGIGGMVSCLREFNGSLYAGGIFTSAGGVTVSNIARWNGSSWAAAGASGLPGRVDSLGVAGTRLFAGGPFSLISGQPAQNLAFTTDGSLWGRIYPGLDGPPSVLEGSGPDLIAAGTFTTAGGAVSPFIARLANAALAGPDDRYFGTQGGTVSATDAAGQPQSVLCNDGGSAVAALLSPPDFGTLDFQPNGRFTFSAGPNEWGITTFTYTAQSTQITVTAADAVSVWRYLNPLTGIDPNLSNPSFNATWPGLSFNDTAWGTGSGLMGYGTLSGTSGTLTLDTNISTPASGERRTAYFRRQFNSGVTGTGTLRLRLLREDAAIVYVNGVEVLRSHEAGAAPEFTSGADTWSLMVPGRPDAWTSEGDEEITVHEHLVSGVNVVAGTNQLAVSVHNNNNTTAPTSSDLGLRVDLAEISVGTGGSAHTATLYIADGRRPPVLSADGYAASSGVALSSGGGVPGLYANDGLFRPGGSAFDPILEALVENVQHGTVTAFNAQTGQFTFLPDPGYTGAAAFSYRVRDKDGWSLPASVQVFVTGLRTFSRCGFHPASILTGQPALHSITPFHGRLYLGCGNYNDSPATTVTGFDPGDSRFHIEHVAGSDAIDIMRVIGNSLWVPHADPVHFEDFKDFSWNVDGVWHERTGGAWYHLYDMAGGPSGALYAAGSELRNNTNNALLGRSTDNGITWTSLNPSSGQTRAYWCFELGGRVYCQTGSCLDSSGVFTPGGPFTSYTFLYKPTKFTPLAGAPFIVALASRNPAETFTGSTSLVTFDGSTIRTLAADVKDFAIEGAVLYILRNQALAVSVNPGADSATFSTIPSQGIEPTATCLAALEGDLYYGTTLGELFCSTASGSPMISAGFVSDQPPGHGRSLAFQSTRLAVGSPDQSSGAPQSVVPLAGRSTVFEEPAPGSLTWTERAVLQQPVPSWCAWTGKDIAVRGDLTAVLSPGADASGASRGADAEVSLYFNNAQGLPVLATTTMEPFAHSAGISPDGTRLVVSTANQPGSPPGLSVYTISRPGGIPALTFRGQLDPSLTTTRWGYRPVTRLAFMHDLVIGSFSGDPSRGGDGVVVAWKTDPFDQTSYDPVPVWKIEGTSGDRFGFSLAADGNWLAVGAPGHSSGGFVNRGAVYWYSALPGAVPSSAQSTVGARAGAEIGGALALSGRTLLLGGPGWPVNGVPRGIVGEFHLDGSTWSHFRSWQAPASSLTGFGIEVAIGDVWMGAASRAVVPGSAPMEALVLERRFDPQTGINAWWEARQPGTALPNLDSDADGDGWSLLDEYVWGLNPLLRDHRSQTADFTSGIPDIIRYSISDSDPRVSLRILGSTDLSVWTPSPFPPVFVGTTGIRTTWQQSFPGAQRRYYRTEASYRR